MLSGLTLQAEAAATLTTLLYIWRCSSRCRARPYSILRWSTVHPSSLLASSGAASPGSIRPLTPTRGARSQHTRSHPSQRSPLIQGETDQSSLAPSTEGTAPSAGSRSGLVADNLCQWERCGSGLMECLHPTTARDNLGAVWQLQPSRGRDGAGEARHSRCSPFQCRCSAGYKDEALPPEKGGCRFSKLVVTRSHKPFLPSDPISRLHRRPLAQKHIPL